MLLSKNEKTFGKDNPLMASHDTALPLRNQLSAQETQQMLTQVSQVLLGALELGDPPLETDTTGGPAQGKRTRGRPQRLVWSHLWASLLLCALSGMRSFAEWRRFLGSHPIAGWAPVWLCRNALVKRLMQAGLAPLEQLWGLITDQLDCLPATSSSQEAELAPFASRILCLDETKLDRIARRLRFLRELPAGEAGLFAGKVLALFEVRAQSWFRLEWRENVLDNSLVDTRALSGGLAAGLLVAL
jgi:hypothetical protein